MFVAAMKRKAVLYISQAVGLNFLLYLHIWSWYARKSGARWGYRDRVERRKTFQASSQDDKPSIRRFYVENGQRITSRHLEGQR